MRSVIDTLFTRRPIIRYTCPAICEVIFSATGSPIIVLEPLNKKKGPTGLIIGGRGHVHLTWSQYPGALCYNVYTSALISAEEQDCACSDVITLAAECVQFDEGFEINDYGCYYVTAITNDGETELSDPYCFDGHNPNICPQCYTYNPFTFFCNPTVPSVCPDGEVWDPVGCRCITCPVETCDPGFHWDTDLCACVPDGGCTAFIDAVPDIAFTFNLDDFKGAGVLAGEQGAFPFFPFYSYNRTYTTLDQLGGQGKFESVSARYGVFVQVDNTFTTLGRFGVDFTTLTVKTIGIDPGSGVILVTVAGDPNYHLNPAAALGMNKNGKAIFNVTKNPPYGSHLMSAVWDYTTNSFTDLIRNTTGNSQNDTLAQWPNDNDEWLCYVSRNVNAPSGHVENVPMIWSGGVLTEIVLQNPFSEDMYQSSAALNNTGNAAFVIANQPHTQDRPAVYYGGVPSFLDLYGPLIRKIDMNNDNVVVWDRVSLNAIYTWDPINGLLTLPVTGRLGPATGPWPGQLLTQARSINDNGLIIGTKTGNTGFVYRIADNTVYDIIDLLPMGHGWDSIDAGFAITNDNYIMGLGTKDAVQQIFVAQICF